MLRAATVTSLLLFLLTAPAMAHIVASPDTAITGDWFRTALRVSHGCEGKDTKKITVFVPNNILIIKPQAKPGWKIDITKRKLAKPVAGPHGPITEVTEKISWTGELPDQYFDEFGLSMKLPDQLGEIALLVLQECKKGFLFWKDMPGKSHKGHHEGFPAPVIKLKKWR